MRGVTRGDRRWEGWRGGEVGDRAPWGGTGGHKGWHSTQGTHARGGVATPRDTLGTQRDVTASGTPRRDTLRTQRGHPGDTLQDATTPRDTFGTPRDTFGDPKGVTALQDTTQGATTPRDMFGTQRVSQHLRDTSSGVTVPRGHTPGCHHLKGHMENPKGATTPGDTLGTQRVSQPLGTCKGHQSPGQRGAVFPRDVPPPW